MLLLFVRHSNAHSAATTATGGTSRVSAWSTVSVDGEDLLEGALAAGGLYLQFLAPTRTLKSLSPGARSLAPSNPLFRVLFAPLIALEAFLSRGIATA